METKFTSGPWFTKREGFSTVYVEARIGGGMIQEVAACGPTAGGPEQQDANARLISAAPELLEALISVIDSLGALSKRHELLNHMSEAEAGKVFAALAKAQGDAQ